MTLARLENWKKTAHGLHRGVLLLGLIQRLTQPPQPAYLELGLEILPQGLSTGDLPNGGRVNLDFASTNLVYVAVDGSEVEIPLNDRAQAQVFTDLFGLLAEAELAAILPAGNELFERIAAGVTARGERYKQPQREDFLDESILEIDRWTAGIYMQALQAIFTALARFRARLSGTMTKVVVWPEHFDLSTLLFVGNEIDDWQPHLSFGFAPFSEGLGRPYLYAYAYPYPEQYEPPVLPSGARWHTQGWTGVVLPYEEIAARDDTAGYVENSCLMIYEGLLPLVSG
jgi:hypothetical protein